MPLRARWALSELTFADPLEYNREVDDTLELDLVLKPSAALTNLLASIDRTKVKTWILTNAYVTHAKRVLKLLDIERFFDGMTPDLPATRSLTWQVLRIATMDKMSSFVSPSRKCMKRL